jgi:hypothetical protein
MGLRGHDMRKMRRLGRMVGILWLGFWLGLVAMLALLRVLASRTGLNRVAAEADEFRLVLVMDGIELKARSNAFRDGGLLCVMGGAQIDLRETTFAAGRSTIRIGCLMGGTNIIVPEGVKVTMQSSAVMGGSNKNVPDVQGPDAPELHVRVLAIMGGANVTIVDRD